MEPNAYREIAERIVDATAQATRLGDTLASHAIAAILREEMKPLVKAAAGRPAGAVLCAHQIRDRMFHDGRIYCFSCLRTALQPYKEQP